MGKLRGKAVKAVFRKEIIDILRDKRTLAIMILLPLILYPALMILGSQVSMMVMRTQETKVFAVAFDFRADPSLIGLMETGYDDYRLIVSDPRDIEKAFDANEITAYTTRTMDGSRPVYTVYYKSSDSDSNTASNRLYRLLNDYNALLSRQAILDADLEPAIILEPISYTFVNLADDGEQAGMFLGMILPLILVLGLVTGAMYPAIDVTAGEKERGTLETLLTLPVNNIELMTGKYAAVSTIAIISALLNFVSLLLAGIFMLQNLAAQAGEDAFMELSIIRFMPAFIITLVCIVIFALFVSAVILCVTSLAKSFKEAQNYITPMMLLFMLPAYLPMIPDMRLSAATAAIPVLNIALLIKDVLLFRTDFTNIAIVFLSNLGYVFIGLIVLSRIYHSEGILFGSTLDFSLFERRSNIIKGGGISPADGLFVYITGALILFYLSSVLVLRWGTWGVAATQLILLGIALAASVYLKADSKKTFNLSLPVPKHLLAGLCLWMGAFMTANLAGQLLLHYIPMNTEQLTALEGILMGDSLWITLVVVAVLPAICEELFFRGFLIFSLKGSMKTTAVIVISGILFGIVHLDFIRLLPTTILGMAFGYAVLKSGSILVPLLMHLLNNGTAVLVHFYPQAGAYMQTMLEVMGGGLMAVAVYVGIAAVSTTIGVFLFRSER